MKVIAAYLLAALGGNASPMAEELKAILSSVGAEADNEKMELLLSQVKGKDLTELIAAGREMIASVASGGGGVVVVASGGGGGGAVVEEKVEEKKVEEKEESEEDFGFDLFG
ncbi:large ribosomal subunit protein P2A-like [Nicotiana sylvestris]|uniref:60S acidic ribosomal protein P2A-like n=1 Tax=Nicotiana sylvestris TaxID=4096 RepID=A0A1U7WXR3_NICSY|nr:PREDICTED: 60S acidic ribosomal protein P2A-like [Nicotiana sylvestris]